MQWETYQMQDKPSSFLEWPFHVALSKYIQFEKKQPEPSVIKIRHPLIHSLIESIKTTSIGRC